MTIGTVLAFSPLEVSAGASARIAADIRLIAAAWLGVALATFPFASLLLVLTCPFI